MKKKSTKSCFSDRIWFLFQKGKYSQARKLLLSELRKNTTLDNHWLLCRLSTTYYEEKKYREALAIVMKARRVAPNCPIVLWDHAGTLDMIGRKKEAIVIWKKLLRNGLNRVAFGKCGEGLKWAKGVMLDCYYRLALTYRDLNNYKLARYYMAKHINGRYPGNCSIYSLKEARVKLNKIVIHSQKENNK